MKKNQLFAALLVCLAATLLSFALPADTRVRAVTNDPVSDSSATAVESYAALYDNLDLGAIGLSREAMNYAVNGYNKLKKQGLVENDRYLTIIDFSQSSRQKRFYMLDMKNQEVVMNTYVSHGKNTGLDNAEKFSNTVNSHQSSLGFYLTKAIYTGKHGRSMRLAGLEEGFNSNAEARAIVMHGASYVNEGRVNSGYMGRSQGCPALSPADNARAIELIRDGSVLFIYHPTKKYILHSTLAN